MRIQEATKFLGIPANLISEIIDDHNLDVDRYINGNHDLSFRNLVFIYMIYHGETTTYRGRLKFLGKKIPTELPTPNPKRVANKKWYPRKHR